VDTYLFRLVNEGSSNPLFDRLMPWITDGGNVEKILPACGIAILIDAYLRRRPGGVFNAWRAVLVSLLTVVLFEWIFSHGLRNWISRPRPPYSLADVNLLVGLGHSSSFPSSHAGNTMGVATVVSAGYPKLGWALLLYAALVAYSRVYVGVHYPLDVLVGAGLGALLGAGLWQLSSRLEPR
jgi:undecaprenyl-diphosphatase